jgi:4a-hydroxytetrahydrobiopterin dehydratase
MDVLLSLTVWANSFSPRAAPAISFGASLPVSVRVKATPTRLSDAEIQQRAEQLPPEWTTDGAALYYEATFTDFVAAIAFVNALVDPAETLDHHPDIQITYNRVALTLATHDAGGLTDLDFELADAIALVASDSMEGGN